jgi:fatty-acyl-CoA synthase
VNEYPSKIHAEMGENMRQFDSITLGDIVKRNAWYFPQTAALVDTADRTRFNYRQLNNRINQCAHMLMDLGIRKGDTVLTWCYNQHEYIETRFAAAKIGAISVPIGFRLAVPEMCTIADHSNARLLLFDQALVENVDSARPKLSNLTGCVMFRGDNTPDWAHPYESSIARYSQSEPECDVLPKDIEALLYTSGTTGVPKGVVRTHANAVWTGLCDMLLGDECFYQDTIRANVMPLFHMGGFECGFLPTMIVRGANILIRTFDPNEFLKIVEKERVTVFFLVPSALSAVVNCQETKRYDVSALRHVVCAAAPLQATLRDKALKVFGGAKLYVRYGSTEIGTGLGKLASEEARFPNEPCIGTGSMCSDIRVLKQDGTEIAPSDKPDGEVGQLAVRSPSVMLEYYRNRKETETSFNKDGYYLTGDLVRMDTLGNIYIAGRVKDMIISGGENIYPAEIENMLFKHPGVQDATVIGVPHERWGETPRAIVVPKQKGHITEEEIIEFCRSSLTRYKCPTSVLFVESIPRTPAGKVQKNKLTETLKSLRTPDDLHFDVSKRKTTNKEE